MGGIQDIVVAPDLRVGCRRVGAPLLAFPGRYLNTPLERDDKHPYAKMPPLQRLSAMRSRAFRRSEGPKTPEPTSQGDVEQPPSPPRHRFRLKKRTASHLNTAPTQQFLASVAAADVAIPSIEEPLVVDEDMVDLAGNVMNHHQDAIQMNVPQDSHSTHRIFSPPKTPVPEGLGLTLPLNNRFPDWSIDSALSDSECESSRPSTARSTQTSASLFSQLSYTSDDLSLISSPVKEHTTQFDTFLSPRDAEKTIRAPGPSNSRARKAPWTQAMSKHLWSTYTMYLQDPKVTPVRIGPSGVPPYGVVVRVAREARRSWKGSNPQFQAKNRSGSTTPTADAPATFLQWPHTNAATRAHLIEMCKANAGGKTRNERYFASSPTPYGKTVTRSRARRMTPARSPSVFSGSDMAMSLAVSTSDSMQLGGPLAQLTNSVPEQQDLPPIPNANTALPSLGPPMPEPRARLGSPFVAKSYGPSSSSSLAEVLSPGAELPRQSHTVGPRRGLKSPARLCRSRSNTQKRRADIELRRSKRPSLPSDMWSEPAASPIAPPSDINDMRSASPDIVQSQQQGANPLPDGRARLGSPFGGLPSSFSFPARSGGFDGIDSGVIRRPFASVHQSSGNDSRPRTPLPVRLAYLDERLKQIRQRDEERRRSESPL